GDERPEGDNVQWMAGYWYWDEEREGFIWISGFYRDIPPHHRWVPGSWNEAEGGWQWSSGYWALEEEEEVFYLPPPPEPVEAAPATPAPDENSIFVPACWIWRETRYVLRPAFWCEFRPDWVWCPAHYICTPAGWIFVEGFWDFPLHRRGLLFAPVAFERLPRRDVVFTPSYVVSSDFLPTALF